MGHVLSVYFKMPRTKKFTSKPKLRGIRYVVQNKKTDRRQPPSDESGKNSCDKVNVNTSNKKLHDTSVNTEMHVGENNFLNCESNFAQAWNIVVSLSLIFGVINKNTNCKLCGGHIYLLENPSKRRDTVRNFVTKGYKYDNTADIMT
jgi:hypothetical protein